MQNWEERGVGGYIYDRDGIVKLSQIIVPKAERGRGLGSACMNELVAYADKTGRLVLLSPSKDLGGSSVARLRSFYRRFGFTDNKGRKKDWRFCETMIRRPVVAA